MTQIDELDSDRIFRMAPIEFMEALARIADKAQKGISPQDKHAPLHIKFENLLWRCMDTMVGEEYMPRPLKSIFEEKEEIQSSDSEIDY